MAWLRVRGPGSKVLLGPLAPLVQIGGVNLPEPRKILYVIFLDSIII